MKLWMTRDKGKEKYGDNDYVHFWKNEPIYDKEEGWSSDDGSFMPLELIEFKSLTGLPLPRKGSKRLVDVKMVIAEVKR